MRKFLAIFVFLFFNFCFSQKLKELNIQDSISAKYPGRNEITKKIGNIFSESNISKDAVAKIVKQKLSGFNIKTLTTERLDLLIHYYRSHYLWLLIDNSLKNFNDEEIDKINEEIAIKRSREILIGKFRLIEKQCIKKFEEEF